MSRFIVFVIAVVGVHFVALPGLPDVASAVPPNGHQLLQILKAKDAQLLKAKDAQFDNALLTCLRSGQINVKPFPAWTFPEFAKEQELKHDQGGPIYFRHIQTFLVRSRDPSAQSCRRRSEAMIASLADRGIKWLSLSKSIEKRES